MRPVARVELRVHTGLVEPAQHATFGEEREAVAFPRVVLGHGSEPVVVRPAEALADRRCVGMSKVVREALPELREGFGEDRATVRERNEAGYGSEAFIRRPDVGHAESRAGEASAEQLNGHGPNASPPVLSTAAAVGEVPLEPARRAPSATFGRPRTS